MHAVRATRDLEMMSVRKRREAGGVQPGEGEMKGGDDNS